jgi:major type 1 subunit fimbrin (pilin)
MRKIIFASAAAAALALAAGTASAANGTINFNGEVVSNTCTVSNADGSGAINVTLPRISTTMFTGNGTRAGQTYFTIDLTGCTPASGQVGVRFVGTASQLDLVRGLFVNTGTAGNVEVGVYDLADAQLKPAQGAGGFTTIDTTTGAAQIPLNAYYVATGAAVAPGTVKSTGAFELEYK